MLSVIIRGVVMLSVIIPSAVMPSVVAEYHRVAMLSDIMVSFIMPIVVMLNAAPMSLRAKCCFYLMSLC
jgi:hypothetical protein